MDDRQLLKDWNATVTGRNFVDKDVDNYIYASLSQPPLKIVSKNDSDDRMDYTVECPTCGKEVRYGTEIFMLSGHHYCINPNCREQLLHILGKEE